MCPTDLVLIILIVAGHCLINIQPTVYNHLCSRTHTHMPHAHTHAMHM